jgi:hypothetical protein
MLPVQVGTAPRETRTRRLSSAVAFQTLFLSSAQVRIGRVREGMRESTSNFVTSCFLRPIKKICKFLGFENSLYVHIGGTEVYESTVISKPSTLRPNFKGLLFRGRIRQWQQSKICGSLLSLGWRVSATKLPSALMRIQRRPPKRYSYARNFSPSANGLCRTKH